MEIIKVGKWSIHYNMIEDGYYIFIVYKNEKQVFKAKSLNPYTEDWILDFLIASSINHLNRDMTI